MAVNSIVLDKADNVGVAVSELRVGERVICKSAEGIEVFLTIIEDIPLYHKFALRKIEQGEAVYKYGHIIGLACRTIEAGAYVHQHNLRSIRNP